MQTTTRSFDGGPLWDTHPLLLHYTTAAGLIGILDSGALWSTHMQYLNDEKELRGFFDSRFPDLFEHAIQGLTNRTRQEFEELRAVFKQDTCALPAYLTSFCSPSPKLNLDDGLLSQWRGYGEDGGYAVVFDIEQMNELVTLEHSNHFYGMFYWGDVDYIGQGAPDPHPERAEMERETVTLIRDIASRARLPEAKEFESLFSLATRHKHVGFHEEREVRLVSLPMTGEDEETRANGETRPIKRQIFGLKRGLPIPRIALFDGLPPGDGRKYRLPIEKVIVGPHPQRHQRAKAVKAMLEQVGSDATVAVSSIPFIG